MIDYRILICVVASVLGHFVLAEALSTLPPRKPPVLDHKIQISVVTPAPPPPEPPPPEPPKPPEPAPTPEPKVVHDKPIARPVPATVHDTVATDVPIADRAVVAPESSAPPVFGVTMESTSTAGAGPAMPVGNTTTPQPGSTPATAERGPAGTPVAAYEVTKMPLPQGSCSGKYTDEARAAAIEGVVVLDLVVDEKGRARDIKVVSGLDRGLTEAAIAALRDCRFAPGEKSGKPVPVRVRSFKIRFVLQDAN